MKTTSIVPALLFIILIQINGFSQDDINAQLLEYKTGIPVDWPAHPAAVEAPPNNQKVLYENDRVRVLEVTLRPGEMENMHYHKWPGVLYIPEAGEFVEWDSEGKLIFDTRNLTTPLVFPLTMWQEPQAIHAVENLSHTQPMRLLRVELKE